MINSVKKYIGIIILILVVGLIIFTQQKTNENKEVSEENKWLNYTNYIVKNTSIFTTNNWFEYNITDASSDFSIAFPSDWKTTDTITFSNQHNLKIAEFSPGLVRLKPNQACFDIPWSNEYGESELISQSNIEVGLFKDTLIIEKSKTWDGTTSDGYWYPHFYCLSNGNQAFVITFFERKLESNEEELYDEILSTFVF